MGFIIYYVTIELFHVNLGLSKIMHLSISIIGTQIWFRLY